MDDVLHQQKMCNSDLSEEREEIRRKLAAAEERARNSCQQTSAQARAFNERVSQAQTRKWEFDAASQDTAQKLAERLADAENRKAAEDEARIEKTRLMNARVEDAKIKRDSQSASPPTSPAKHVKSVESIKSEIDAAVDTKNVRMISPSHLLLGHLWEREAENICFLRCDPPAAPRPPL